MTNRLDVSALVTLVGKDKIRSEINKNTWYYNIIYMYNEGDPILNLFEVPDGVAPLEYLVFNDLLFLRWILDNTTSVFSAFR